MKGLLQEAQENVSAHRQRLEVLKSDRIAMLEQYIKPYCEKLEKVIRVLSTYGDEEISVTLEATKEIQISGGPYVSCTLLFKDVQQQFVQDLRKEVVKQLIEVTRRQFEGFEVFQDCVQWNQFHVSWKSK